MSWQATLLVVFSRLFVKPLLSSARDVVALRARFERDAARIFRPPPFSAHVRRQIGGVETLWVENRQIAHNPGKVILYMHGGGFVAGSPYSYHAITAQIARRTGLAVCAPHYRLAPEHPFPAGLEDCLATCQGLFDRGYAAKDIIVGGDSAGGSLTFLVLSELCRKGMPPAGAFAVSPASDFTFSGAAYQENQRRDPILPSARKDDIRTWYLGAHPDHDLAAHSPVFADFPSPPPVFLQYAETEILRDDAQGLAARLRAHGAEVTEDVWQDMPHVFSLFHNYVPESREALSRLAAWIRQQPGFSADQGES